MGQINAAGSLQQIEWQIEEEWRAKRKAQQARRKLRINEAENANTLSEAIEELDENGAQESDEESAQCESSAQLLPCDSGGRDREPAKNRSRPRKVPILNLDFQQEMQRQAQSTQPPAQSNQVIKGGSTPPTAGHDQLQTNHRADHVDLQNPELPHQTAQNEEPFSRSDYSSHGPAKDHKPPSTRATRAKSP